MRSVQCYALAILILLAAPVSSHAQTGCSVVPESWREVQEGLDLLALGACFLHDSCYRACNPPGGPYYGYGYKASCDLAFYADLVVACNTWSIILTFPNIEWVNQDEFLDDCYDIASAAYAGVSFFGFDAFLSGQCSGCNAWACNEAGLFYRCRPSCGGGGIGVDDCDMHPWRASCGPPCPLALDLQGNGLKLTGPNPPVRFDLDIDGKPERMSWTREQTKDGFLVLDRNRNGKIDDGREMFGTSTVSMLSGRMADHGYEALAEFDRAVLGGTEDNMLDQHDKIFEHLRVWLDVNRDAQTQEGELKTLAEVGIAAISLSYLRYDEEDQWGNVFKWWSPIYFEDGSESKSFDIFFERVPD